MNEEEFEDLLTRYLNDTISEEELDVFLNYISTLDNAIIVEKIDKILAEENLDQIAKIKPLFKPKKKKIQRYLVYTVAASLALFIAFSLFIKQDLVQDNFGLNASVCSDILMGDSAIIVKTAEGEVSLLDEKDRIYHVGSLQISLDDNGQISYAFTGEQEGVNEEITIHIPKGRTSYLQLSDSSKVWLNSNSTIKFKPFFNEEDRFVKLSGEAYFEVKHDKARPFIVHTSSHDIEVLGTSFNVSSYKGMTAHTTLLEGKVRVKQSTKESILKPLQQFSVNAKGETNVASVDVQGTMAWKEGLFVFDKMHLKDIILYLSNWYPIQNIEVEQWTEDIFTGAFKQERSLKSILDRLSKASSYQFQITDGTLEISVANKLKL